MLEVRKNTFARSYENTFFREFSRVLSRRFEEKGFNGLLLGSPFCEEEEKLQIDALLITTNAICIIDFKNYSGKINLPDHNNFEQGIWTNEKGDRVKGGSSINPFVQLAIQKKRFEKVVNRVVKPYILSSDELNIYHTDKIVCFQNDVEFNSAVPPKYTNFHITDKAHFIEKILDVIDITNQTKLSKKSFEAFNEAFLAAPYKFDEPIVEEKAQEYKEISTHFDQSLLHDDQKAALTEIYSFLNNSEQQVFVLQGTLNSGKSYLIPHIQELAYQTGIQEVEVFAPSARVANNLLSSVNLENINSIYSYIYGGTKHVADPIENNETNNDSSDSSFEIIPLKSCDNSDNALFIVDESQLVSDSHYQSFDMMFGTGHLLQDFLTFTGLKDKNRKIIFIGDPYQLQLGNTSESPMNPKYLEEHYELSVSTIQLLDKETFSHINHEALKCVKGMNAEQYNLLSFSFNDKFSILEKNESLSAIRTMINKESSGHVLTYSNEDANNVNLWIKDKILNTGKNIAPGDLISFYNNITLAKDNDPFAKPMKIYNGEFATVVEVSEIRTESITPRGKSAVELKFREIILRLKTSGEIITVLALENFRLNPKADLSDEEITAYKVLLNTLKQIEEKKYPFEKSKEHSNALRSNEYLELQKEVNLLSEKLKNGEKVKGVLEDKKIAQRKILRVAKRAYKKSIELKLYADPSSKYFQYKNTAFLKFGWAMTVHRSMTYQFDHVIFNMNQGGGRGRNNDAFFRWIYTGLSRATDKIQLINYESISPFDKIILREDTLGVKPKEALFHSAKEDQNERLKNFEAFISNKLKSLHLTIDTIEHFNWQERYNIFGKSGEELILNVSYDGKGNFKIPTVMKSEPAEFGESVIERIKQKVPLTHFDFIQDHWRRESYLLLAKYLEGISIHIESIISNNYHDTLKLYSNEDELEIDIWYGADGMFSKIISRYYSDSTIWDAFKQSIEQIRSGDYYAN